MAGKYSTQDKAMAARLRAEGDKRDTGVCCICGALVRLVAMVGHYSSHCVGGYSE